MNMGAYFHVQVGGWVQFILAGRWRVVSSHLGSGRHCTTYVCVLTCILTMHTDNAYCPHCTPCCSPCTTYTRTDMPFITCPLSCCCSPAWRAACVLRAVPPQAASPLLAVTPLPPPPLAMVRCMHRSRQSSSSTHWTQSTRCSTREVQQGGSTCAVHAHASTCAVHARAGNGASRSSSRSTVASTWSCVPGSCGVAGSRSSSSSLRLYLLPCCGVGTKVCLSRHT